MKYESYKCIRKLIILRFKAQSRTRRCCFRSYNNGMHFHCHIKKDRKLKNDQKNYLQKDLNGTECQR